MMFKKTIFILLILNIFSFKLVTAEELNNKKGIIISNFNNTFIDKYLDYYNIKFDSISISNYKKNRINFYEYIFVINDSKKQNIDLLTDISETNKKVCWIDVDTESINSHIKAVYDDTGERYILKNTINLNESKFKLIENKNVLSYFDGGTSKFPFLINKENYFYSSIYPNELILEVLLISNLNSFYSFNNNISSKSSLIIEDFDPFTNFDTLQIIMNKLNTIDGRASLVIEPEYLNKYNQKLDKEQFINMLLYIKKNNVDLILNNNLVWSEELIKEINLVGIKFNTSYNEEEYFNFNDLINYKNKDTWEQKFSYDLNILRKIPNLNFKFNISINNSIEEIISFIDILKKNFTISQINFSDEVFINYSEDKNLISEINNILIILLSTSCLIFFSIFIYFKKNNIKSFYR